MLSKKEQVHDRTLRSEEYCNQNKTSLKISGLALVGCASVAIWSFNVIVAQWNLFSLFHYIWTWSKLRSTGKSLSWERKEWRCDWTCSRWLSPTLSASLPMLPATETISHNPPGPQSWSVYLRGSMRQNRWKTDGRWIQKRTGRGAEEVEPTVSTHLKESWCPH